MTRAAVSASEVEAPVLRAGEPSPRGWSAYGAIAIDAAVDLTEDRRFHQVPINERLETAAAAQRAFLNGLLSPSLNAVLDLRISHAPGDPGLAVGIVLRALGRTQEEARARALDLLPVVCAQIPDHVIARVVADQDELERWRRPLERVADAAFITREEITAVPQRRDIRQQGIGYLFSVVPFHVGAVDWSAFYRQLLSCPVPVVVSIALQPREVQRALAHTLAEYATVYGKWGQPDRSQPGIFSGDQSLPAEGFAVDAAAAFADYSQRLHQRCFATRIVLASSADLPPGLAQGLGGVISPPGAGDAHHLQARQAATGYCLRDGARGAFGRSDVAVLAEWDIASVDLAVPPGEDRIWSDQRAAPPAELADLAILGDAREAAVAFRLPIAPAGMLPGIKIRRGRATVAEAIGGGPRSIDLGDFGDAATGSVRISVDSLSKHVLIAGSTGSGKTTMVLELLRQLWPAVGDAQPRIPFMVIEPVNAEANDYRKLASLPEIAGDLQIYTVGDERHRPLRFNPFAVPRGVLVSQHMSSLLEAFKAAFGLWDPLPAIYEEAITDTYAMVGVLPSETSGERSQRWPTVITFYSSMVRATASLGYKGEVQSNIEAASKIRARQLAFGPCASAFRTDEALDIDALLAVPTILELKTLGSTDEQALMIALLINAITAHYKANRGARSELAHVTVIEEAHRLLARATGSAGASTQAQAKEQAAAMFANVLAENRKYGEGVIIAEQIPTKLVEDAVKNTNLKVMCRLTAEEERRYLGDSMALGPEQQLVAARLTRGQALVYSDEIANATEIRSRYTFGDVEPPADIPTDRSPPFSLCILCEQRCRWRPVGLAVSRRLPVSRAAGGLVQALGNAATDGDEGAVAAVSALARSITAEAGRYDAISSPENLDGAIACATIHALESRVDSRAWIQRSVSASRALARQAAASPEAGVTQ